MLSACPHQSHAHSTSIPIASFATSSVASTPVRQQRFQFARDRLNLIRAMQRESDPLRVLALTDNYRRLVSQLPHHDDTIDMDAHLNPHALNHLCMSPRVTPLDYCVLIYHLLRVGAIWSAAALVNEMGIKQVSVRAVIRAVFAHHLVAAALLDKAREMLAPNSGDPATPLRLDKVYLSMERPQPMLLPPDVAILLMSPDDSPFFRSDLFHDTKQGKWRRSLEKGEAAQQSEDSHHVAWENVLQCFDFLRAEGYLEPRIDCYHHVMERLAEVGQVEHCRRLFGAMQQDGVLPTTDSYLHLMRALLRERLGAVPLSKLVLDKATSQPDHEQRHNQVEQAYAAALSRQRQVLKLQLLTLHSEMVQKHVAVNDAVYSTLIQACCLLDDEKRACQLFDEMRTNGIRPDLSVVHALLSLTSPTPRYWREIRSIAVSLDNSVDTCQVFIASAIRRRFGAAVIKLLHEVNAGFWKWPAQSTTAVSDDSTAPLASLYSSAMAACSEAEMYDVTSQLFSQMREADLPTTDDHHHAFVQALCRTGRVSIASAHLAQMPASFDLIPSLVDWCTVMIAAADMPPSEERLNLLNTTARLELFGSLLISARDGTQTVLLNHYPAHGTITSTIMRGLLLWMQYIDSQRFDERLVTSTSADNFHCTLQLSASEEQHECGLCARVKAMLDESVSATTGQSLRWRRVKADRWRLNLSVSAVREVRDSAERERGVVSADERQPPPLRQADLSETNDRAVVPMHTDNHDHDATTLSAAHRTLHEQRAP